MANLATVEAYVENGYKIVESNKGHSKPLGIHANQLKNPFWRLMDDNNEEIIVMHCEKDTLCKLCPMSYRKLLDYELEHDVKITWFVGKNGYITGSNKLYMHQIIMGCHGNGKGTKTISVDHIDQNPLNNTFHNLRIATRKEQEDNTNGIKVGTKRKRSHAAKDLPEGITQDMMKKYVIYYHEWLDPEHTREREFFKVEKHPKLEKPWMTSKSNKISIQEKLTHANQVVDDLDKGIYPCKKETIAVLPQYVSLITHREKPHLVFEKRQDGKRLNFRMVLPDEYDLEEQLGILNDNIKIKYDGVCVL
jgi:hypothetical protein